MKHVSFANDGLIDLRAVTVFGASSKETANPIGYFGTGLKYAIAVSLRLGCKISLWRGEDKYTFHAQPTRIRVDDFDLVCMEGPGEGQIQELAFTTELGKNWEAWQAFRELWCNAIDEGGEVRSGPGKGKNGMTIVEVVGDPMMECYNHRDDIMLMGAPKWFAEGVEVHYKRSAHRYYRNVRVGNLQKPAALTYNVVGQTLDLTEDRTLKYEFLYNSKIAQAIASSADEDMLKEVVFANSDTYESDLDFSDTDPGPALLHLLEETDFRAVNNKSFLRLYQKQKGEKMRPALVEVTNNEDEMLTRAIDFLVDTVEIDVRAYKINVTNDLEDHVLGAAYDGEIWLNRRCLMRGTKLVAGTLLEEYVHLHHGLMDETRALQDWFLDALMTLGERFKGEPL
jgi:hypothetical protein